MRAKDILVRPIASRDANRIIRALHYSGKAAVNPQINFGVFIGDKCGGAMQFGPSLDRRKMLGLVTGTGLRECLELNRMAFADWLPRNSESRVISVTLRMLRRSYPHLKWVLSFADATQCGDGTIYRACGFVLTAIKASRNLARLPGGQVVHKMTLESNPDARRPELGGKTYFDVTGGVFRFGDYVKAAGATVLPGFQLRYIYFLQPEYRARLTVPEIPYSRIAEVGASMYRGKRAASIDVDASGDQPEEGGSSPTAALHSGQAKRQKR